MFNSFDLRSFYLLTGGCLHASIVPFRVVNPVLRPGPVGSRGGSSCSTVVFRRCSRIHPPRSEARTASYHRSPGARKGSKKHVIFLMSKMCFYVHRNSAPADFLPHETSWYYVHEKSSKVAFWGASLAVRWWIGGLPNPFGSHHSQFLKEGNRLFALLFELYCI